MAALDELAQGLAKPVLTPLAQAGKTAPSVALATLSLTAYTKGVHYAAIEARSMMIGAVAFAIYALAVAVIMMRFKRSALVTTLSLLTGWLAVAVGMWWIVLG